MFNPFQPDIDEKVKPPKLPDGATYDRRALERARYRLSMDKIWAREARLSLRYYGSDMYRYTRRELDQRHTRMFANYVRKDLDRRTASVLDAELRVRPVARHPKWHSQVKAMFDYLEYTKDSEDYKDNIRRAVVSFFQIGEGVLFEGFDPDGNDGQGMHEAIRIDARSVLVDPKATRLQNDDARWIIVLEHVNVEDLKRRYDIKTVLSEGPEFFMESDMRELYHSRTQGAELEPPGEESAWLVRMWHKEMVKDGDKYKERLFETVAINDKVVKQGLSPFDRGAGGHGHYPFAFFKNVLIDGETRARGEIGFLIGISDARNEALSMLMDHMWLMTMGFMDVPQNSYRPEERAKMKRIGREMLTIMERLPGSQPAQWRGHEGTGAQAFQGLMPLFDEIQDREGGLHDSSRGLTQFAGESGRHARALQAADQLLNVLPTQHLEAGLERLNVMRLHNIQQFTNATFMATIVNTDGGNDRVVYVGKDYREILNEFGLQPGEDPVTKERILIDRDGEPATFLAVTEDMKAANLYSKVRVKLDTARRANKQERADIAREFMQIAGPAGLEWGGMELEVENLEVLLAAVDKANTEKALYEQATLLAQQVGLKTPEELLQMLQQQGGGAATPADPATAAEPAGQIHTPAGSSDQGPPL